jgi:hypothetical protein
MLRWDRFAEVGNFRGHCILRFGPNSILRLSTGQAQYLRVPFADFNALKLPPGKEHEADFVMLAGESLESDGRFPYDLALLTWT